MFCIPKELANAFKEKLKSGIISPEKLIDMTSQQRHEVFSNILGESNAQSVNALFESKLLLKSQQQGIINWAKKIVGMKPEALRDIVSRVNRMTKILEPKDLQSFLGDLSAQRLGFSVSYEEAATIAKLAKEIDNSKIEAQKIVEKPDWSLKTESKQDRLIRTEYGTKLALFKEYIGELKQDKTTLSQNLIDAIKNPKRLPILIGNISKSVVASLDNSFFLNQGRNALFDPKTTSKWADAFKQSFGNIKEALLDNNPIIGVKGEIYSRKNALNRAYERAKLDIGIATEEAIPTTLTERIPLFGRLFKASNTAYNGAALKLRADIFDQRYDQWEKSGIDMNDKTNLESLGQTINAFTGRGDTGRFTGENVNALVFSAKFAKSNFDVLTAHIFSDKITPFAKRQAAYSLLRMIGAATAIMAISEVINPGSTELDPRATNFGKIRIGKTWYPTPISFAGIPNVIARTLIPTKHNGQWGLWMENTNGKWTSLMEWNNGQPKIPKYGAVTALDIAEGYFEGKSSPILRSLIDVWNGQDFNKNPSTVGNVAKNLITPLSPGSIVRSFDNPEEKHKIFNTFMTILGSNPSTPGQSKSKPQPLKFK